LIHLLLEFLNKVSLEVLVSDLDDLVCEKDSLVVKEGSVMFHCF